jgi:hypothetical protein
MRIERYEMNKGRNGKNNENSPFSFNERFPKICLNIITPVTKMQISDKKWEKFNINFKFGAHS